MSAPNPEDLKRLKLLLRDEAEDFADDPEGRPEVAVALVGVAAMLIGMALVLGVMIAVFRAL